jgi:N-methylhydantoinase A/oxoprolinase/acetone carboxylase beta subunit
VPVVCSCELSHKLNAKNRATTTILNAHLIPIIRDLIYSVKKVLREYSINAPLMVVKGDGSVFQDEVCFNRPVETILSGPAASVVGAGFLMEGLNRLPEKAVVMDIGGTTSDIAVLQDGFPRLNENGVAIGPWQTHVAAVDVRTVGLGGDSHIQTGSRGEILIGPKRVEPLCLLAKRVPDLVKRLKVVLSKPAVDPRFSPTDFWVATGREEKENLTAKEKEILKSLFQTPLNIFQIAERVNFYPISFKDQLVHLENLNLIRKSGFTPTDIFHINNRYSPGDRRCSLLAAEFYAGRLKVDVKRFIRKVFEIFNRKAGLEILDGLSSQPVSYTGNAENCPACNEIWRNCFWEREHAEKSDKIGPFQINVTLDTPIVGVGAPAYLLVPTLAKRMGAVQHIPEHAEVANAIGAVVGTVLIKEQVLIRPSVAEGFVCFTSKGKSTYATINEAIVWAGNFLEVHIRDEAKHAGGDSVEVKVWQERKQATLASGDEVIIEVILHGEAVAKPRFEALTRLN